MSNEQNNNVNNEILFFKNEQSKFLYILMSKHIDEEKFYKLFPKSERVEQDEFDKLHDDESLNYIVIPVGDSDIIDEYFTPESHE